MATLAGKVALITGAKGGLGSFVTQEFLGAGATVVGVARSIEQSDFPHAQFVAMPADLTRSDTTRALLDALVTRFGKVDILAHIMGGFAGGQRIEDTDDATWDRMMDINARSAFNVTRAVMSHMRRAASGRIIAIGARAALEPVATLGAYNASKAALVALIRTLALEGKDAGISANVILPGTMDTPANRAAMPAADVSTWVRPETVAGLALWLAAEAGQEITGAAIPVYGKAL